jgi:hypothetical protein
MPRTPNNRFDQLNERVRLQQSSKYAALMTSPERRIDRHQEIEADLTEMEQALMEKTAR